LRRVRVTNLEKCEEYLRRHPDQQRQGIVPDLQIGTALYEYELKGIRHALGSQPLWPNYNEWCAGDRSGRRRGGLGSRWRSRSKRWIWMRSCLGWLHRRLAAAAQ
jgi:hypothetical protein